MSYSTLDLNILRLKLVNSIGNMSILKILNDVPEIKNERLSYDLVKSELSEKQLTALKRKLPTLERELEKVTINMDKNHILILNLFSSEYPQQLKSIFNPPVQIYCKGFVDFPLQKTISVVGTRRYTPYGKKFCEEFVDAFVNKNIQIISGLALGIDSIAHIQALKNSGKCIGVVGSGFDYIYPSSNVRLYERILESNGTIITEHLPHEFPIKANFPMRNRIIAGLSKGTLVIEAAEKSGSLITAKYAFDEGREVYAIPADLTRTNSQGCNYLIKNQIAKLVNSPEDILKDYGFVDSKAPLRTIDVSTFSEIQKRIVEQLSQDSYSSDALSERLDLEIGYLNAELSELELFEVIFQDEYKKWKLN